MELCVFLNVFYDVEPYIGEPKPPYGREVVYLYANSFNQTRISYNDLLTVWYYVYELYHCSFVVRALH